mmetsp:Transcript_43728/g.120985  ORF Transcript_43728/g.120985 Transcript_43728/m.120985 type:complete len:303 (-) Transcript_43728:1010-1918(-)
MIVQPLVRGTDADGLVDCCAAVTLDQRLLLVCDPAVLKARAGRSVHERLGHGVAHEAEKVLMLAFVRLGVDPLLRHHIGALHRRRLRLDGGDDCLLLSKLWKREVDDLSHKRGTLVQHSQLRCVCLAQVLGGKRKATALQLERKRDLRRVVVLLGVFHLVAERLVRYARVAACILEFLLCRSTSSMCHRVAAVHLNACCGKQLVEAGILRPRTHAPNGKQRPVGVQLERHFRVDDERKPLVLASIAVTHAREALAAHTEAVKQAETENPRRTEERVPRHDPTCVRAVAWEMRLVAPNIVHDG